MLVFEKTCDFCPEQYDVFDGDKLVGYVRLRGSRIRAFYPNVSGECIYEEVYGDSGWDGCFDTEGDRKYHLTLIELAIQKRLKEERNP